jgi:hypothetical protein
MPYIVEDYRAIARRQREIAIMEGHVICPTCKSKGWHEYADEEGGIYFTECSTCGNPLKLPRIPPDTLYVG